MVSTGRAPEVLSRSSLLGQVPTVQSVSPQVEFCGLHAPVTGGSEAQSEPAIREGLGPGPSFKYPQEYVPLYLRSLPKKIGRWPQAWGKWQREHGLQLRQTSAPGQQVATGSSRWSSKALQPQVYLVSPLWGTSAFLGFLGACRSHQALWPTVSHLSSGATSSREPFCPP